MREGARALYKLARRFLEGRGVRQDTFKATLPPLYPTHRSTLGPYSRTILKGLRWSEGIGGFF